MLFDPLKQVRVSHVIFKIASLIDLGLTEGHFAPRKIYQMVGRTIDQYNKKP